LYCDNLICIFRIGVITPGKHRYLVITLAIRQRFYTVIVTLTPSQLSLLSFPLH